MPCIRLRTSFLCAGVVFLVSPIAARAQTPANQAVDKVFEDLAKPGSPGCALGVYHDGKIIYAKGYGLANLEENVPITPQTVFDIGSTSKQFTAASILLLEKQGKLRLDDDIRKYIPELPDYGHKITILNLLNHTSGLRDYLTLMDLAGINIDSVTTDDDALAIIARQKALNFPPGDDWLYSNSGFFLLSVIVQRAGGKSLREFARENIFAPLGMTHTQYRDDHTSLIPDRALAYDTGEKGGYKLDVSYFEQAGDGAVHTSIEDLQKWDENFYSAQVGGKEFLTEIQERGKLTSGKTLDYAKGLFISDYRGLHAVSHGGAWGGYRAELLRFPEQHFAVACLCNVGNANPSKRAHDVADVYLGAMMRSKEAAPAADVKPGVTLSTDRLRELTGIYREPMRLRVNRVFVKEGKLYGEMFSEPFELRPLSDTEFVPIAFGHDAKIVFEPPANGRPRTMRISGDDVVAGTFQQIPALTPSQDELVAYSGAYASDELAVVYVLAVADGKLRLQAMKDPGGLPRSFSLPHAELQPTIPDEFDLPGSPVTIHFARDANRKVMGFTLDAGRTRRMIFTRKDGANR